MRFTLVELMIVVAIVAILAAIAIPNFYSMQLRAKRGEVPTNLDGIVTAQAAYNAAMDGYVVSANANPSAALSRQRQAWLTNSSGWLTLGWAPDGDVYGKYQIWPIPDCAGAGVATGTDGQTDIDGDGTVQRMVCCMENLPSSTWDFSGYCIWKANPSSVY